MLNKKQLNKCKAFFYYDGKTIADSEYVACVSYDVLIFVWHSKSRTLYVGKCYNSTPTTRQHSSKFLHQLQCGVSYHDVVFWLTKCFNGRTGEIINAELYHEHYGHDTLIYPCFSNSLYFKGCFTAWRLENAINEHRLG